MAQVDYFIKIEGVDGESTDDKHKKEIDVESFSWGETNSGTAGHGSGSGAGKVHPQDFTFTKRMDKSSPVLFVGCAHRSTRRGQYLRAQRCLNEAVDLLLGLVDPSMPAPRRRLEARDPELARELLAVLLGVVPIPELRLLEICEQRLRPFAIDLCWSEFSRLRDSLRAPAAAGHFAGHHYDLTLRARKTI